MRYIKILAAVIFLAGMTVGAKADNDEEDFSYRGNGAPRVDVWTNKGYDANYYYGEDVAVYFRADNDCYVVVYDVDPSGNVNVLFPNTMSGATYVQGGQVYRIPDTNDNFRMEISGNSGRENIYAVASYDYLNPPDFMKYIGYDYGPDQYYDDNYFITQVRGDIDNFTDRLNDRIASGPYSVAHTRFYADTSYRHHQQYRYSDYGPYDIGSVWVGGGWPGCEVWVDGIYWGIAPLLVPRVIVGYHWVWIYYGGYPCYQNYFYVPAHRRYNVNIRIDNRYRDYRYRRDHFRGWQFDGKRYRNEPGFVERSRPLYEKNIRVRSLPSNVVRDYTDRGIISRESPIAKRIRADAPDRGRTPIDKTLQPNTGDRGRVRPDNGDNGNRGRGNTVIEKPTWPDGGDQGRGRPDNGNQGIKDRGNTVIDRPDRGSDNSPRSVAPQKPDRSNDNTRRIITPEKPQMPDKIQPVERDRQGTGKRVIEKHESDFRDSGNSRTISRPQQPNGKQAERVSRPQQNSSGSQSDGRKSGGTVERQRPSNDNGNQGKAEKDSQSSRGNSGRSGRAR